MQQQGWLQISTEGFASFNKDRPKQHLVKELVQNAFDAIGDSQGSVELEYWREGNEVILQCRDSGSGVYDLSAMRVVYLTFKQDSHLRRGRFGRGFKEILSVAEWAAVLSGGRQIIFGTENGEKVSQLEAATDDTDGTIVQMGFKWSDEEIADFDSYFESFLVPQNISFKLNGRTLAWREPAYRIDAQLTTEIYFPDSQSWRKPRRKTVIELIRAEDDEDPFIYELGIPVATAEWTIPYHANIAQRVPMNPNRDALATGYAKRIHAACLPIVLPDLEAEEATADWVGSAGVHCEPEVQKKIITKAFGENAARSVPSMGKRDFDHDAERVGAAVVKTSQMSGGFREMAKTHLPSAKQVVDEVKKKQVIEVVERSFEVAEVQHKRDERTEWVERRGGIDHVNHCLNFALWFCQKLLDASAPGEAVVTGKVALGARGLAFSLDQGPFLAAWSGDNVLTLALECDCFWERPMGAEALEILVHEAAHCRNMHHGKGFTSEIERLAGVAAALMFEKGAEIRQRWSELV